MNVTIQHQRVLVCIFSPMSDVRQFQPIMDGNMKWKK
jgi:hypothetical protein